VEAAEIESASFDIPIRVSTCLAYLLFSP